MEYVLPEGKTAAFPPLPVPQCSASDAGDSRITKQGYLAHVPDRRMQSRWVRNGICASVSTWELPAPGLEMCYKR